MTLNDSSWYLLHEVRGGDPLSPVSSPPSPSPSPLSIAKGLFPVLQTDWQDLRRGGGGGPCRSSDVHLVMR